MKKQNLKYLAACAALLSSSGAFAGATGNVGAVSEYVFRGVEQSAGAAVQGGLDWSADFGLYAGTWVSSTSFAGYTAPVSYETDVYGGWTKKFNDNFGVDIGAVYYYYRDDTRLNTIEGYVGLLVGTGAIKAYYTPSYFGTRDASGDGEDGLYVTANYAFPLSSSVTLTPQVGYSVGDGVRDFVVGLFELGDDGVAFSGDEDDSYIDFSLALSKTLDGGLSFSLGVYGTNLENDDEKVVIGLKKSFDL